MISFAESHYEFLGVSKNATPAEIRQAYHEAARQLHPDVNSSPGAADQFIRAKEAYEVLSDAGRRSVYDKKLPRGEFTPGAALEIRYSRETLTVSPEEQLLYALLDISPYEVDSMAGRPRINLSIVIDRSTSMQGTRLHRVKKTASDLVQQLNDSDILSVISFSDRGEVVVPSNLVSDRRKIDAQIGLIQASGGTEIYQGLQLGFQELSRYKRDEFINYVILITDGHTYGDEEHCLELADRAAAAGVTILGLGIGSEWNDRFLDDITKKTGGHSTYVARSEDISNLLEAKFQAMNESAVKNIVLHVDESPDVDIRYAFRLSPDPGELNIAETIPLGALRSGHTYSLLLELMIKNVPATDLEHPVLEATLTMDMPGRFIPKVWLHLSLTRAVSPEARQEAPPESVLEAMSTLTLFRMQERAKQDVSDGNVEQATTRLRYLATRLLAQGEDSLATAVLDQAGRLAEGGTMSKTGEKEIKYGTRALLLRSTVGSEVPF